MSSTGDLVSTFYSQYDPRAFSQRFDEARYRTLLADAMRSLHAKQGAVKFFGSWPRADGEVVETRAHADERSAQGIPPLPLNAEQVNELVTLLKAPPTGEEDALLDLLTNRVPPGVDEAAYVKAGFLAALAKGEAGSPLVDRQKAVELLGTMLGGYNIQPLIDLLDDAELERRQLIKRDVNESGYVRWVPTENDDR